MGRMEKGEGKLWKRGKSFYVFDPSIFKVVKSKNHSFPLPLYPLPKSTPMAKQYPIYFPCSSYPSFHPSTDNEDWGEVGRGSREDIA